LYSAAAILKASNFFVGNPSNRDSTYAAKELVTLVNERSSSIWTRIFLTHL